MGQAAPPRQTDRAMDARRERFGRFEIGAEEDEMICRLSMPCDKKRECVLCAALWNEREVFKYIRKELEPLTDSRGN